MHYIGDALLLRGRLFDRRLQRIAVRQGVGVRRVRESGRRSETAGLHAEPTDPEPCRTDAVAFGIRRRMPGARVV